MTEDQERSVKTIAGWLDSSSSLLITSGAGLTAAAGLNYGDTELFAREFPGMLQYGVSAQYQMIGQVVDDPTLMWGYWASHVNLVRHRPLKAKPYEDLKKLADSFDDDEVFVRTSNVDALFERNGFAVERLHTPQGDYALMQCTTPCTREVWQWKDQLDGIVANTDPATQKVTDPSLVPRCPNCGETVFMNVRADRSFIEDHWEPQSQAFAQWLTGRREASGLVLEIGAGFNTPSVIRWPSESIVRSLPGWRLARVNLDDADVPNDLGDRAVGFHGPADELLSVLASHEA